jgi:lysophospholipase L1-like esterase
MVFIGDSLTLGWKEQPQWKEKYEKLGAVNFGVGGDGTSQVLWRLNHGILDGMNPHLIVLGIGINNTWSGFDASDTVLGVKAVLTKLKQVAPDTRILLLGNTHFFDSGDGKSRQRARAINSALSALDDGHRLRFLDFSHKLIGADDALDMEHYLADKLHLSQLGYEVWAKAMDPILDEMLEK